MSVRGAEFLGLGLMAGAGIFGPLGEAAVVLGTSDADFRARSTPV